MIIVFQRFKPEPGRVLPASPQLAAFDFVINPSEDHLVAEVKVAEGQGLRPVPTWIRLRDFTAGMRAEILGASKLGKTYPFEVTVEYDGDNELFNLKRIWVQAEERVISFFGSEEDARQPAAQDVATPA